MRIFNSSVKSVLMDAGTIRLGDLEIVSQRQLDIKPGAPRVRKTGGNPKVQIEKAGYTLRQKDGVVSKAHLTKNSRGTI